MPCHGREALWNKRLKAEKRFGLRLEQPPYRLRMGHVWRSNIISLGLRLLGVYGWGVRNALELQMREETFCFPDLPDALRGFRILHISDPHFIRNDGRLAEIAAECVRGTEVDLCVLTGDYCWGHFGPQGFFSEPLGQILREIQSRHGVVGILGNHDTHEAADVLRDLGVKVLINDGCTLQHGDADLWIGGTDDPHKFLCASVALAMRDAPAEGFRLLLAHTPECAVRALDYEVDLYLCGHTHGGQVCLPGGRLIQVNARCDRAFGEGKWRLGTLQGFTTKGMGTTDVPVRFYCPPEIALLTLERQ